MVRKLICILAVCAFMVNSLTAQESVEDKVDTMELAQKYVHSWVVVEYYLKYDKGEQPELPGLVEYCSNCGQYHSIGNAETYISQERPLETGGTYLGDNKIISADTMIQPRFLDKIIVRCGDFSTEAGIYGYTPDAGAVILSVNDVPADVKPVEFVEMTSDNWYALDYKQLKTNWQYSADKFSFTKIMLSDGTVVQAAKSGGLIVDAQGNALGCYMGQTLADGNGWMGSPLAKDIITIEQYDKMLANVKDVCSKTVLRCRLNFRSPSRKASFDPYMRDDESNNATERNCYALVIGRNRIVIPVNLDSDTTARLEKITVLTSDGDTINAGFESTVKDYGLMTAVLDSSVDTVVKVSEKPIKSYSEKLLTCAEIRVQGEELVSYYMHNRILNFEYGWKKLIHPNLSGVDFWNYDDSPFAYLVYDQDASLIAMPVVKRPKVQKDNDRWDSYNESKDIAMMSVSDLEDIFNSPARYADIDNVPLSEALENRAAWMGVVLQDMSEDLARINNVAEVTKNGTIGGIVSYVYPDSPAANAGVEPGMILVRLHSDDNPKPIDIVIDEQLSNYMSRFPWDRLDEIPAEYMNKLPTPWPAAENEVGKKLKDIGFGKPYTAEFYQDGQRKDIELTVTETPTYYDSAKKFKSDEIDLTVRDLTFEVRRYMQIADDEPGVIVSKVEQGGKADVAGVKVFEVITHINDKPIMNVKDFEDALPQEGDIRIAIKRMSKGRVVNISI